jgi:hypothetical protein
MINRRKKKILLLKNLIPLFARNGVKISIHTMLSPRARELKSESMRDDSQKEENVNSQENRMECRVLFGGKSGNLT